MENSRLCDNSGIGFFKCKFVGCVEVLVSMKNISFNERTAIAKECIRLVREQSSKKTSKRKTDKRITSLIAQKSCLENTNSDVFLNISPKSVEMKTADHQEIVITRHDMPKISFASGGDEDSMDFICFIGKDITDWRACYVLDCGNEMAQKIISVLGKAFELRYREYYGTERDKFLNFPEHLRPIPKPMAVKNDKEYYNDLPGKVPPDLVNLKLEISPKAERKRERLSSNLIDLETPPIDHNYVNEANVFEKFETNEDLDFASNSHESLSSEKWFHGKISRVYAESLLKHDGEFLVRESQNTRGQFVLSGLQFGFFKHLLLIDPEGRVRTKDKVFNSIQHLIHHHFSKNLPIISSETSLILKKPVHVNRGK